MNSKLILLVFGLMCVAVYGSPNQSADGLVKIHYHLFFNDDIVKHQSITYHVPKSTTFYEAMKIAAKINDDYRFTTIDYPELGHYINSIGGVVEDIPNEMAWLIYILDSTPDPQNPPETDLLSGVGVDGIIVEEGQHYLFWYQYYGNLGGK